MFHVTYNNNCTATITQVNMYHTAPQNKVLLPTCTCCW